MGMVACTLPCGDDASPSSFGRFSNFSLSSSSMASFLPSCEEPKGGEWTAQAVFSGGERTDLEIFVGRDPWAERTHRLLDIGRCQWLSETIDGARLGDDIPAHQESVNQGTVSAAESRRWQTSMGRRPNAVCAVAIQGGAMGAHRWQDGNQMHLEKRWSGGTTDVFMFSPSLKPRFPKTRPTKLPSGLNRHLRAQQK